ncbi:MAG: 50S ribosomal protein L6 [Methanobacteriota archaeon]|nr:MAG: 50S ribosomal protein L6 [Euryarchaeota archaeon]
MADSEKMERTVDIPEGVDVVVEDSTVTVTGPKGTLSRVMSYPGIAIAVKEGRVVVSAEKQRRAFKAMAGTFAAHIRNMITGVTRGFEYRLKVVYSHFPITIKHTGNVVTIENFLGEKTPRIAQVPGDCSVSIKGDTILVAGIDIEHVGQTAANIEKATRVKRRDRRVFQDGIYLVEKGVAAE